ncbi:hypothetical protein N7676_08655 [Stenotrophomonas sp. GD03993]|uniref:hypothetical protein n=1 Tax=unclassified Stenotrophomonas TaxID=196198 RepID=UPI00131040CA|nr:MULTISPECIES: hypothetical protein [unclassified Stenotrophomonas]MDH0188153.1 hypothetical protein [Stenotrophomonas sp. GD04051]MDH0463876.1 hypothetical protein [Stenotrophomonas sp. GD03993]MDH0876713.1 hypothetical protein [Stenotrophomonas sp. GD03877]MDH2155653.1 hypothetical protein [Stenotrophomonas sp. GD03657]
MSEIKRWDATGPDEYMESNRHGMFVLHSDHEAEVARLRAELQNAAKAALDAVALSCEKEREADALRVDAERYRWLRDEPWRDNEDLEPVIRLQLNALWDNRIDAAMGEGK